MGALMDGDVLTRLSGLRVLEVGGSYFINSERLDTVDPKAADALCRYTVLGKKSWVTRWKIRRLWLS